MEIVNETTRVVFYKKDLATLLNIARAGRLYLYHFPNGDTFSLKEKELMGEIIDDLRGVETGI